LNIYEKQEELILGDATEPEKPVEQFIQENNLEAAVQLLVELIIRHAGQHDFDRAESLRDRLIEVDPMAVNEIVKTGEAIEAEKANAIDQEHLAIWADFYERLTAEETNVLFYGLKLANHPADHMIYQQGEKRSHLYFIDQGRLKMFYRQKDKTVLLKTLEPGDIFGEDTFFFSDAFCTTSVITDSPVKLYVLSKDDLDKLNLKAAGLESKLNDYCSSLDSVADLLKAKRLERRAAKRLTLPGKLSVQMLDDSNRPAADPFNAQLLDISTIGLAFLMKTTEKVSTLLLGRNLNMKLTFEELASDIKINRVAKVVAVNSEPFHEYVVHTEFGKYLGPSIIDDLADLIHPPEE
jgi:CRP-like cAMP-binding protein